MLKTVLKVVTAAAVAVIVFVVAVSFTRGDDAPAMSASPAPTQVSVSEAPTVSAAPGPSASPSPSPPPAQTTAAAEPLAQPGTELDVDMDGFDPLEAQWAPVVNGFGADFSDTVTPNWAGRVSSWLAPAAVTAASTVNPANVSQTGFLGYDLESVGINSVVVVAHFTTGGDVLLMVADSGNPVGHWWVTEWYDAP